MTDSWGEVVDSFVQKTDLGSVDEWLECLLTFSIFFFVAGVVVLVLALKELGKLKRKELMEYDQ